jgi:predicted GNAT family N-acyltransferase
VRSEPPIERVTIRWLADGEDLAAALALRERVFCDEQGVPREEEIDGRDERALHMVASTGAAGPVIATLRLFVDDGTAKIGRVAVERDWRRRGIALEMLQLAVARAAALGCERARLAAQVDAVELYVKAGFAVESAPFQEAGITHVWMGRSLAVAQAASDG